MLARKYHRHWRYEIQQDVRFVRRKDINVINRMAYQMATLNFDLGLDFFIVIAVDQRLKTSPMIRSRRLTSKGKMLCEWPEGKRRKVRGGMTALLITMCLCSCYPPSWNFRIGI